MSRRVNANNIHNVRLSFNERVGLGITKGVGTMWVAYIFAGLTLFSLPAVIASHNIVIEISWVTQTFLQLVLLPIIIVGQTLQSKHSEILADEMYKADLDAEQRIIAVQEHLEEIDSKKLDHIISLLEKKKITTKKK
jgi:uncharacterized membrane protein